MQRIQNPLVIIPTYNEADNVVNLCELIFAAVPNTHVCFVDDNSTDGTRDKIRGLMKRYLNAVHILERPGKMGLGSAYVAGFKWALGQSYDAVIEMDADHSHNPNDLPKIIANLEHYHVVIGSRYVTGGGTSNWSMIRQMISRFGSFYGRTILGMNIEDFTGGFNGWRREVLSSLNLDGVRSEGYAFQIELKYKAHLLGFKIIEVPIIFTERRAGKSKMSSKIILEAMWRLWQFRRFSADSIRAIK